MTKYFLCRSTFLKDVLFQKSEKKNNNNKKILCDIFSLFASKRNGGKKKTNLRIFPNVYSVVVYMCPREILYSPHFFIFKYVRVCKMWRQTAFKICFKSFFFDRNGLQKNAKIKKKRAESFFYFLFTIECFCESQ